MVSGCVLHATGLSLIPSDAWVCQAGDWQWWTLMEASLALLMCAHFSVSLTPACSACKSVQMLAVKWPWAKSYRKEKAQFYLESCIWIILHNTVLHCHALYPLYMHLENSIPCVWKCILYCWFFSLSCSTWKLPNIMLCSAGFQDCNGFSLCIFFPVLAPILFKLPGTS